MRSQHIHTMGAARISQITDWLFGLLAEEKNGVPVHFVQSFQVVNQPYLAAASLYCIVICNHSEHVYTESIVQGLAEAVTEGEKDEQ